MKEEFEVTCTELEYISHLEEFSEDDMKSLIDICILRKLNEIDKKLTIGQQYEYAIRAVNDVEGATDVRMLSMEER